jgi:hypothetical protein
MKAPAHDLLNCYAAYQTAIMTKLAVQLEIQVHFIQSSLTRTLQPDIKTFLVG